MKRRNFIERSLQAASVLAIGGFAVESEALGNDTPSFDLVIVGAGTAGLPAAIFASRRGARVLLLDAAADIGGTLHLANGQVAAAGTRTQAAKGIKDTPDSHYADVMRLSRGFADPQIVRRTADEAPATVNWLLDAGLTPLPDHPVTGDNPTRKAYTTARYLWAKEEGRAILAVIRRELAPEVDSGRVTVRLNSRVTSLITDPNRADRPVIGIRAGDYVARGRHVLITTGGYAMNPAAFERLCGLPAYAGASYPYAQGDGLELATSVGGWLRGRDLHRPGSGSILTAESFNSKIYARFVTAPQTREPWEIWVNNDGRRYVREDEPLTSERERAFVKQDRLRYQIVFDSVIAAEAPLGIDKWTREKFLSHFDAHPMFHRAETLEALAAKARIDAAGLIATVRDYNAAVASGKDSFGRKFMPRPIVQAPFYAVTQLGHSATSSAGITVDRELRVLRGDGSVVPNLRAAGEVLGSGVSLGDAFAPGMMLTPALALGRWLGNTLPLDRKTA